MKNSTYAFVAVLIFLFSSGIYAWGQHTQLPPGAPGWQQRSVISAAFFVEQQQWPAGYGIRIYVPYRRTSDLHVSIEGGKLLIRSEAGGQTAPMGAIGPVFVQFGSFSQWLNLPPDADPGQMKIASLDGVINIFIPRKQPQDIQQ